MYYPFGAAQGRLSQDKVSKTYPTSSLFRDEKNRTRQGESW